MRVICISDTHGQHNKVILPEGDLLIHSGDLEIRNEKDLDNIICWFESLNFSNIIFCAGNHDFHLEQLFNNKITPVMPDNIHYLCNNSVDIESIKIFGSPFTPLFYHWAFMRDIDGLRKIWNTIPLDTDIIVTHGQPYGINDQVQPNFMSTGCPSLRDKIKEIKPKYYIGGHLHESFGVYKDENTTYINASVLDEFYKLVNDPVLIDYE